MTARVFGKVQVTAFECRRGGQWFRATYTPTAEGYAVAMGRGPIGHSKNGAERCDEWSERVVENESTARTIAESWCDGGSMLGIQGRKKGTRCWQPFDYQNGTLERRLIYATLWSACHSDHVDRLVAALNRENREYEFRSVRRS